MLVEFRKPSTSCRSTAKSVLADLDLARLLDRLIIGPSQFSFPMCEAFTKALTALGVEQADKRVFISGIPIRS
jgi:hypothetical protein